MATAHGLAPLAPAPTPVAAAAASSTTASVVAAAATTEAEDQVDEAIASALEGISLALSMDNPLGFMAMSPVSRESKIQGEPPQVTSLSSPLSKGEHPSTVSPVTSLGNISSYMDMLFSSKTPKYSNLPE